jgi:hypothetical protein
VRGLPAFGAITMDKPNLLSAKETAAILKTSPYRLGMWRKHHRGPPFIRASARKILYDFRDIEAWLKRKTEQNIGAKPFCIKSPNYAIPKQHRQVRPWVRSAVSRSRTGKRPITLPRLAFLETGGDDE